MKLLWLVLIGLIPFSLAQAENIYVAPIKGSSGVSQGKLDTLRDLIKIHIQEFPDHKVVNSLEKADFYLQTRLIKFERYTLSMSRWKGRDKVISGQWKADSLSDLENVSEQAVRQMVSAQETKGAILIDDKKSNETPRNNQAMSRSDAPSQVLIGFGPAFYSEMNSPDTAVGFQAGYYWNISNNIDMGLQTDLAISTVHSEASLFVGKIAGNYLFSGNNNVTPYIGGGFGYGWANAYDPNNSFVDDTAGGFAISIQGGAKLFRFSSVNFGLGAEYTKILDENSLGSPAIFLIRAGIYY